MTSIASIARGARQLVVSNSPVILTSVAVAGVVTTAYMAASAVPKALQILEEAKEEKQEDLTLKEEFLRTWKCYIPAAGVGLLTIVCIVGANRIDAKRSAALLGAFTVSEKTLKEYQNKVSERIGAKEETKVREDIIRDRMAQNPVSNTQVIFTGTGDVLFYEFLTDRYFESNVEKVRSAQNDINAQILHENYASLSDFYNLVGLKSTFDSDDRGWNLDNRLEIDYNTQMAEDGRPCITISYTTTPIYEFWKQG